MMRFIVSAVMLSIISNLTGCSESGPKVGQTFWPDGSLREEWSEVVLKDGSKSREGAYRSFYESGLVYEEGRYEAGVKQAVWTRWHDTEPPVKIMEGRFVDGEMDGRWYFWMDHSHGQSDGAGHHGDHDMAAETDSTGSQHPEPHKYAEYRHGRPHGVWLSWHPNGQVADSFGYLDGKLEGTFVSYYDNGQAATIIEYLNGERQGTQIIWDETGKVVTEIE